ncbi:hypothetical protein AB0K60_22185 [Thermopolyspora sp. NPDC052614]|uniref:hypothetical protein n=1 Tax=Thermopolyspora sp. NPDC052614 TaxID=3155682 RepID=UPI00341E8D3F
MTTLPATRTVVYLVQTPNNAGEWTDAGEFGVGKSRTVHTVATCVLHAQQANHPRRPCRVLAWDTWTAQHLIGCTPYPENADPTTQLAWLTDMRRHVPPHAEVAAPNRK